MRRRRLRRRRRQRRRVRRSSTKRREDALLRDLGAAVYAERTRTAAANGSGEIERLIADITAHRQEQGTTPDAAATNAAPEGDFKLD